MNKLTTASLMMSCLFVAGTIGAILGAPTNTARAGCGETVLSYYSNNGAEDMMSEWWEFEDLVTTTISSNPYTYPGHTFINWDTLPEGGGTVYEEQEVITFNCYVDLYAQWQVNTYTVSFDNKCTNDAACSADPDDQTVEYELVADEPTEPTREGYDFDYYYDCSDEAQAAFDFSVPITADIQLCAKWTLVSVINPDEPVDPIVPDVPGSGVAALKSPVAVVASGLLFASLLGVGLWKTKSS